jgi:hypothetical protein
LQGVKKNNPHPKRSNPTKKVFQHTMSLGLRHRHTAGFAGCGIATMITMSPAEKELKRVKDEEREIAILELHLAQLKDQAVTKKREWRGPRRSYKGKRSWGST